MSGRIQKRNLPVEPLLAMQDSILEGNSILNLGIGAVVIPGLVFKIDLISVM